MQTERHPILMCRIALGMIISLLVLDSRLGAQEEPLSESRTATTTSNAELSVDHLQVLLRPLTKAELEIELASWLSLLRAKIREVGDVELEIMGTPDGDSGESLQRELISGRTIRARRIEPVEI